MPGIGKAPMAFYLPPSQDKADMKVLIEKHGGQVSEIHECFTYQIAPISEDVPKQLYFWGDVFQGHWIVECIKQGSLLEPDNFYAFENREKGSKRVTFKSNNIRFTITEGLKIFELAKANQKTEREARGSAFWLEVERKGLIPNRKGDCLREFWKLHIHGELEDYMRKAVADEDRYCHAQKQIPQVRPQTKDGAYHQAEVRLFGAASIPVDTRRYNADDKTQKMLRSTSKARLQQKREAMTAVRARMQRTWPEAMTPAATEPPSAAVAENGA